MRMSLEEIFLQVTTDETASDRSRSGNPGADEQMDLQTTEEAPRD